MKNSMTNINKKNWVIFLFEIKGKKMITHTKFEKLHLGGIRH